MAWAYLVHSVSSLEYFGKAGGVQWPQLKVEQLVCEALARGSLFSDGQDGLLHMSSIRQSLTRMAAAAPFFAGTAFLALTPAPAPASAPAEAAAAVVAAAAAVAAEPYAPPKKYERKNPLPGRGSAGVKKCRAFSAPPFAAARGS